MRSHVQRTVLPAALLFCGKFAASDRQFYHLFRTLVVALVLCWLMDQGVLHWLAFRLTYYYLTTAVCSRRCCCCQLLVIDNQTYTLASFHYSCGHLSESGLKWQSLATELFADMAPRCISDLIFRTADVIPRWCRQSSNTYELVAVTSWLTTVEDRPFANGRMLLVSLPEDITSAPSLPVFRRKLKTRLFR